MPTYFRKPQTVEAITYCGHGDTIRVVNWLASMGADIRGWKFSESEIVVPTISGDRGARKDSVIYRDGEGLYCVMNAKEFNDLFTIKVD